MKHVSTFVARILPALVASALLALPASAQSEGINLSWTDCGVAGTENMTFACDVNTGGIFSMVGSYVPPDGVAEFVGLAAVVDMVTETDPVGDWWQTQTGGCRQGASVVSFDFTAGPFSCVDPFSGAAAGGLQFTPDPTGTTMQAPLTNKGRFKVVGAISPSTALTDGQEHYAFQIRILRTNTLACPGGCLQSACIRFNSLLIAQPAGVGDFTLVAPPAGGRQEIVWQGTAANCTAVPVQNRTWGEVKHLYR